MHEIVMRPIGRLRTPFPDKFGVPRQPGLAGAAKGRLVFEPAYRREEAVRGLEGFSHVWIVFLFDGVEEEDVRLSVRPPRLGGNEKRGVFATRSPFRPNRIGFSACALEEIDHHDAEGPVLVLGGVDLVDGTPVLDVKPYLPYADCLPGASGAFAEEQPEKIAVEIAEEAAEEFEALSANEQEVIREALQWDPRPAYHEGGRDYHLRVGEHDVCWKVEKDVCRVTGISKFEERN